MSNTKQPAWTVSQARNAAWHDRVNGSVAPLTREQLSAAVQALDAEVERLSKLVKDAAAVLRLATDRNGET